MQRVASLCIYRSPVVSHSRPRWFAPANYAALVSPVPGGGALVPFGMEVCMFPIDTWLAYTGACILLVLAPGPDNLLAVGQRGQIYLLEHCPFVADTSP